MTNEDVGIETPNSDQGPLSESTSQMVKKCLDIIEEYRRGDCAPLSKVATIGKITDILTSVSPRLTEIETNDSLGSYLGIIDQHDRIRDAARENGPGRSETDRKSVV